MRLRTIAIVSAVVLAAVVVVSALMLGQRRPVAPSQPRLQNLQAQLTQAGYHKATETKYFSGNANRTVTDQRWERASSPETIILSDDTVAGAGVFVINAITYSGADGNGNLTCQPVGAVASLTDILADSDRVRREVHAGTLQSNTRPGQFPYLGKLVGCLP